MQLNKNSAKSGCSGSASPALFCFGTILLAALCLSESVRHGSATSALKGAQEGPAHCLDKLRRLRPVLMVIEQVRRHQPLEMPLIQDDHVVKQIVPAAFHPAFGNTVLPRTAKGRASWLSSDAPHSRNHSIHDSMWHNHVYYGRQEEILRGREEQKQRTIEERLRYNLVRSNLKLTGELESKVQLGPRAKPVSEFLKTNTFDVNCQFLLLRIPNK